MADEIIKTEETPVEPVEPIEPTETDFGALLEGVDLNKLLEYDGVKKLVQAQSDKRVTQALATAKTKWEAAQEAAKTEAKKLEQMTEEQKERYKLDQDKADFEAQKAKFQHDQLVVETQKQMISAGLPDLAAYITGTTAEETTANLAAVTKLLSTWKAEQLNKAMRGKAPKDTNPTDGNKFITKEQLKTMTPAEINKAWAEGRIDTKKL